MSQNFEDSPISDNKMDISDATTSQEESTGVSPINDNITSDNLITQNLNEMPHLGLVGKDFKFSNSSLTTKGAENGFLDNDTVVPKVLRLGQKPYPQQEKTTNGLRSELVLANSHPLMSPTATDSDSENSHYANRKKAFNFPDVVPESEQIMSTPPITKRITSNTVSLVEAKNSLNTNHSFGKLSPNNRLRVSPKRAASPDVISSESEAEVSQFQATVEANYQSVALIAKAPNRTLPKSLNTRKQVNNSNSTPEHRLSDDMSSLDSISNHSFEDDDDLEHNLASLSPSSSLIDGLNDDRDDDFPELDTPTNLHPTDQIPFYSAADERRDSRNWQKITLPDGRTREIDMKVIEPYKRVLSHGGYLKAGGHNAIVMFCACHLPDRSRADYHYVMDNLFLYVVKTLEQLVTEDYVLIYLHGGSSRRNVPPFPWLKKCYQLLDRRLRKSLKNLYLVHPTFWLKSIVWMSRPFVSSKFWRKLVYVQTLNELSSLVNVESASIPDKVKQYDAKRA
ncbi:bcl-2/adenovirus E1B 19 kDa-interacting protein 2-like protein isoform X2 [Eupeodes corollae]|uniref:bcl-2/adenovirus E1B 19 kDa-interacting protein 2-like protein isoform X2 n=1 Tax=Eupeodes corollae TaxID=290404 RepID=UPI002492DE80|nr:bcl-2/adenovirus E1B 19 kDa-interacting protein 2-like protein isoform X2 [Eupeodes corollae]